VHPETGLPLDLSASILRSVSPMHLQYLKNMGVAATLTISLISDNTLWGLIVCHHRTPRFIPYDVRAACEFVGQLCSSYVAAKQDREDADDERQVRAAQAKVFDALRGSSALAETLASQAPALLTMAGAAGVVISLGKQCVAAGRTPAPEHLAALIDWLADQPDDLVAINMLPADEGLPDELRLVASGVLAIAISKCERQYVIWLRPEVVQTVRWGGNPHKPVEVSADSLRLSPRTSFELWKEQVRGAALPWKACEVAAVSVLRLKLIDHALSQAVELRRQQDELITMQTALLAELSTPLIPINDHLLVMPLIGAIDSQRAQQVLTTLLEGIADSDVRTAILDVTGVVMVDTQVANALVQAAQAVQLLGAQVILTGIRPEIAQTLIGLGVELRGIITQANLQMGIAYAMQTGGARESPSARRSSVEGPVRR
jgi:light-regulated signal transduction histidine kinase (bacteriophytochrome)